MFTFSDHFVGNGAYRGDVETTLRGIQFDPGMRRPYIDKNGQLAVTVNTGRTTLERGEQVPIREHRLVRDMVNNGHMAPSEVMVTNATSLRKEEWLEVDKQVVEPSRYILRMFADIAAAKTFGGFNGMGKMILEHETMSDPGEAMVDMNGLSEGRKDSPLFQLEGLPLPIIHADFDIDLRKLTISRNSGTGLDVRQAEFAGRRIAETLERLTIGNQTGPAYGGLSTMVGGYGRTSQVYGALNFSSRLTQTGLTAPTTSGWTESMTLRDVLTCLQTLRERKQTGPWMVYHSNDWDNYLDDDYILTGGNVATQTLRNRLRAIEGIQDVKRLDMLFSATPDPTFGPGGENLAAVYPFTMIFVDMQRAARAVVGMAPTTMQWEMKGGMVICFKTMQIQVPQFFADYYGNCGVLQATFNGGL